MPLVQTLLELAFALAWLSAVVHGLWLGAYRREDVTRVRWLLFGGVLIFDHRNFRMDGWPIWRRFRVSFAATFVLVATMIGARMLASQGIVEAAGR